MGYASPLRICTRITSEANRLTSTCAPNEARHRIAARERILLNLKGHGGAARGALGR